jgi:DNA-directed RNA polymerase subunit alpha
LEETNPVETLAARSNQTKGLREALAEVAAEDLDQASFRRIAVAVCGRKRSFDDAQRLLTEWDSFAESLPAKAVAGVLQGYCLLLTGQTRRAEEVLKGARRHPWGLYHHVRLLLEGNRTAEALEAALEGAEKLPDFPELIALLIEAQSRAREFEAADKALLKLEKLAPDSALLHYARGVRAERSGAYDEAIACYREAVRRDREHQEAYFRLGFLLDLHGTVSDEANEAAVEAYEACIRLSPVHTNGVINLGLVYEDRERYHDAIKCFETVLRYYPNDLRAKLYLGDAMAATRMFYDRDQEKKADRQSQVLKIPVTDFELSVRSRNCLAKMNIKTLGDLIMKTEQELLSYKNFGETSLDEIKVMLSQKGLRLGQGLEEKEGAELSGRNPLEATANPETLSRSIDELDLSVRSRRCMERLGVRTVRELINKTEVELMAAKNFGMTSLNEIKRKLAEMNLTLRG